MLIATLMLWAAMGTAPAAPTFVPAVVPAVVTAIVPVVAPAVVEAHAAAVRQPRAKHTAPARSPKVASYHAQAVAIVADLTAADAALGLSYRGASVEWYEALLRLAEEGSVPSATVDATVTR